MTPEEVRRILARDHPELCSRAIAGPSMGTNNDCFEVDGRWICRFAKDEESVRELQREIFALERVRPSLPARVPDFLCSHRASSGPRRVDSVGSRRDYVVYRRIGGEPLLPATLEGLDPDRRRVFAADLGRFLAVLHQTPLAGFESEAGAAGLFFRDLSVIHQSWIGGGSDRHLLVTALERLASDPDAPRLQEICAPYFDLPDVFRSDECRGPDQSAGLPGKSARPRHSRGVCKKSWWWRWQPTPTATTRPAA